MADDEKALFHFRDARITESSGLAMSPTHPGIVYTHNDSGDGPRFFAVDMRGRTKATFDVAGAVARDWEAMAASVENGHGVLWLADIGDNLEGAWPDVSIYKVVEPTTLRDATVQAVRYRFRYAGGGRNAEGVMVNPRTGRLYVISKEFSGSIYAAPRQLRSDRVNILKRVGSAPIMATDAAYAPDGSSFVIRTYFSASLFRAPDDLIAKLDVPSLAQSESITYTRDGKSLLTGSEGRHSPVYEIPLPADAIPTQSPPPTPQPSAALKPVAETSANDTTNDTANGSTGPSPTGLLLWVSVALAAIAAITFIARRAR
ncbi:hypothetical protein J5X84_22805 [Streptosporangiaceae bacterium NEAU-GS5]|nr:hypothetical protein [Streptosporangiaceae bacterium NEAU-GS5]